MTKRYIPDDEASYTRDDWEAKLGTQSRALDVERNKGSKADRKRIAFLAAGVRASLTALHMTTCPYCGEPMDEERS